MPRKRTPKYTKPATAPHPSLTSSLSSKNGLHAAATSSPTSSSVNELIQQYRRSHISKLPEGSRDDVNPHTVHPSLRAILHVPDTPAPRPRPGMRVVGGRRGRFPAGPPPPNSWLRAMTRPSTGPLKIGGEMNKSALKHVGSLPGLKLPEKKSLLDMTLKALAQNWPWHQEYDQFYLATLPIRHKEALISYIAFCHPQSLDIKGLELLFLDDEELEDATGSESVTHLDFASSIGYAIKLKDIPGFFTKKQQVSGEKRDPLQHVDVPESWDRPSSTIPASISVLRFPSLTHLSFAHAAEPSWKQLLGLSPHLATITHLSLACWPIPSLIPNAITAYRETPAGNVDYGASNFYSLFDGDLAEAASVLRRLSKATYCLRWLDLTGCGDWLQALVWEDGADWCGAWRGMETVKIGQGWLPSILKEEGSQWRLVFEQKLSEDEARLTELGKTRAELVTWGEREKMIGRIDKLVNALRTQNDNSSFAGSRVGSRSSRIHFDRGWDGWWIEDALNSVNAMGKNEAAQIIV